MDCKWHPQGYDGSLQSDGLRKIYTEDETNIFHGGSLSSMGKKVLLARI